MLYANENDAMGQAVTALISKAIPVNQSLKEEDFDYYVEDLQDQIITHFNYHTINIHNFLRYNLHFMYIFT